MPRHCLAVAMLVPLLVLSCAEPVEERGRTGQARSAITHGHPDTDHDAVVALLGPEHVCSGTIVATAPPHLYVLTAAHCVAPHAPTDPELVLMGQNYVAPDAQFAIEHCLADPGYDGDVLDFAMCRATGATASTPVIAVQSGPDGLELGGEVTHVGYGITEMDGNNSQRNWVAGRIAQLDPLLLWYPQADGGPCSGDSGGPQLSTDGVERVVGVTSFGDRACADYGASGRVAAVYESFVLPYIAEHPAGAEGGADSGGGADGGGCSGCGGTGAVAAAGAGGYPGQPAAGGAGPDSKADAVATGSSGADRGSLDGAHACALRRAPSSTYLGVPSCVALLALVALGRRRRTRAPTPAPALVLPVGRDGRPAGRRRGGMPPCGEASPTRRLAALAGGTLWKRVPADGPAQISCSLTQ